jgi:hypothetical protein
VASFFILLAVAVEAKVKSKLGLFIVIIGLIVGVLDLIIAVLQMV